MTVTSLAKQLGVSITTVSFVLNGQAKRRGIADETARRVLQAAQQLNYVPNDLARSLRRQRSGVIGLVVPHFRNDWAQRVLDGMYPTLDQRQLLPLVVSHRGSAEQEARELDHLMQRKVEGIILNPLPDGAERYRAVMARGVPVVFIGDTLDELPEASFAAWDPAEVALAVRHLVRDAGCTRIAYLGFDDSRTLTRRCFEVFQATLRAEKLRVNRREWVVLNRRGETDFRAAIARMFGSDVPPGQRPDGLFALYNDTARAATDALQEELGLAVGRDVALATWGDTPMVGPRAYNLTTVAAPVPEEGRVALENLLKLTDEGGLIGPLQTLVSGGRLVVGASTADFVRQHSGAGGAAGHDAQQD